jgi:sodium/pantothenate symporter
VFLAGPLAAIMSTIDSQLILASATLIKDLYLNYIRKHPTEEARIREHNLHRASFCCTALIGTIVFLAALRPPELIVWLNLFAFGGLQAAFLWPVVLGLYWKRATARGVLASMICGVGTYVYMAAVVKRFMGMHVIVPSLTVALIALVGVSLLGRGPSESVLRLFWGDGREK